MADKEFVGLRFFRILMPGFSTKLLIPSGFGEQILKTKTREMATLVGPTGKVWHVEIYNENKQMCMGRDGWQEFVQANNLKVGYILILRYRGNLVFTFRVFDSSTWEKSPPVSNKGAMKRRIPEDHAQDENSKSINEPATVSDKKMKGQEMDPSTSYDDKTAVEKLDPRKNEGDCDWKPYYFEASIKASNVRGCFMHIPTAFKIYTELSPADHKEISVTDPEGKTWLLGLIHMNQERQTRISRGWGEFARCNKLKLGDRVGFELISTRQENNNKVLQLQMYKLSTH